jgi:rod shape-determining protein MreD
MKPRVYLMMLLLIIPVQASLFSPLSLAGIKPDLPLALIYIIGLLTGPTEASLAGMGIGLIQDIGSASLIGMNGFTRGLIGLGAGFLGRRVLDIASPSNVIFLAAFSLMEGIVISMFMQIFYGTVPFFSMFFTRMVPQALYTGLLGTLMLRIISNKNVATQLIRRSLQKE